MAGRPGLAGAFRGAAGPVYEDAAELRALDSEGRCVVTDHGVFVLFNCYLPNAGGGEDRRNFKMRYNRLLQARVDRMPWPPTDPHMWGPPP